MRATRMTVAASAACIVLAALGAATAEARTDNRSKPIVFVHGLDAFGEAGVSCSSTWGTMASRLGQFGHSGTKATIAYYGGDTNCTHNLGLHGSHSTHYPRTDAHNSTGGRHDMDADIRHLGYHLAWTIYNTWSKNGVTVDAVGHSMGGLILRYMLHRIQANDSAFPPYLYVEDVVTLGTPHLGSGWASGCTWAYECVQMENARRSSTTSRRMRGTRRATAAPTGRSSPPMTTASSPRARAPGTAPRSTRCSTSGR